MTYVNDQVNSVLFHESLSVLLLFLPTTLSPLGCYHAVFLYL